MAARKPKRWDLVEVTWLDAWSTLEQHTWADAIKLNVVTRKTLGYFVFQDVDKLIIAGTDDRSDSKALESVLADLTIIPAPWAVNITILQRAS